MPSDPTEAHSSDIRRCRPVAAVSLPKRQNGSSASAVINASDFMRLTRPKISNRWRDRPWLQVECESHRNIERGAASGSLHRLVRWLNRLPILTPWTVLRRSAAELPRRNTPPIGQSACRHQTHAQESDRARLWDGKGANGERRIGNRESISIAVSDDRDAASNARGRRCGVPERVDGRDGTWRDKRT